MNEELASNRAALYGELKAARRHFVNNPPMLDVIGQILYGDEAVFDTALAYLRVRIKADEKAEAGE